MTFITLEDLCQSIIDCPHSSPEWKESGIPVIRNFNLNNTGIDFSNLSYVDEGTYEQRIKRARPEAGDIVISREAPMGVVGIIPDGLKCCLGQRLVLLKVDKEKCDPYYLLYVLGSDYVQTQIKRIDLTGSIVSNLNIPDLKKIVIPVIDDQQRVAILLQAITRKVENNNKINAELESMAKTIYDYWFLQFEFPNEEGKPYKSSGGKMVWNEELKREIPEGWTSSKVKDCLEHINTGLNPRDNFLLNNGDIKYITVKNLNNDGTISFDGCDTVNEEARRIIHARSDITAGDILFASIIPLGRCFLLYDTPQAWDINESVFSIRSNTTKVSPEYLYLCLTDSYFVKKAEQNSVGSVFNGIRIRVLEEMNILLPPKTIIDQFTSVIRPILSAKDKNGKENQELIEFRDFLLPLLMNGQVGFKDE